MSGPTTPSPTPPPASTAARAISGGTVPGDTLSVTTGGWSPAPSGYAYAWQQCDAGGAHCIAVGSVAATYMVSGSDVGHTLRAVVTATNSGGSTSMATAVTAVVTSPTPPPPPVVAPANTAAPVVSAGSQVGQTVTVHLGPGATRRPRTRISGRTATVRVATAPRSPAPPPAPTPSAQATSATSSKPS